MPLDLRFPCPAEITLYQAWLATHEFSDSYRSAPSGEPRLAGLISLALDQWAYEHTRTWADPNDLPDTYEMVRHLQRRGIDTRRLVAMKKARLYMSRENTCDPETEVRILDLLKKLEKEQEEEWERPLSMLPPGLRAEMIARLGMPKLEEEKPEKELDPDSLEAMQKRIEERQRKEGVLGDD